MRPQAGPEEAGLHIDDIDTDYLAFSRWCFNDVTLFITLKWQIGVYTVVGLPEIRELDRLVYQIPT